MNRIEVMKQEKVSIALMKLGLPAVIGMLTNALYNVADTYFVSGISAEAVGGTAIAYPLTMIVTGVGGIFGHGAASYISRLIGQEKKADADNTAISSCIYSLMLSCVLMGIVFAFMEPILKIMGATEGILPYASEYTTIYMIGAPFGVMAITLNNLARSEGAAKESMKALFLSSLLNIFLDMVFINVFEMGIKGAAIATVIAQVFTTVFLMRYFLTGNSYLKINFNSYHIDGNMIREMLKVGIPTFMFQLLTSVAIGLTNYQASVYGDDAIAAIGIVLRLMSIGLYVVFGYTKGFQPFVGYNYGSRNIKRVKQAIQVSLQLTTIFCGAISLVFIIFSEQVIKLFIDNQEIVTIGSKCLVANSIFFVTFGYQMVYATLFLALGKGKEGGIISLLRQGICLIPLVLILPTFFGLYGLLYAQGIADVITTLITSIFVVRFYQELSNEPVTL